MFISELTPSLHPAPKVSVCVTTFNHEPFIAQALDSILMQQTTFPYEIIVGDDCSTDHTREIVREYERQHPESIRIVLPEQNLGAGGNPLFVETLKVSRGDYVAIIDGDDYWTSPHKLQKQVTFLEQHPECSICFHNAQTVYEDVSQPSEYYNGPHQKEISTIEDLWHRNFLATCSVMLRNGLFSDLPEWYKGMRFGDWPLYLLYAQYGSIGYLCEVMAVYRIHRNGIYGGMSAVRKWEEILTFYDEMLMHLPHGNRAAIAHARARHGWLLAHAQFSEGNMVAASKALIKAFISKPFVVIRLLSRSFLSRLRRLTVALRRQLHKVSSRASIDRT